MRISTSDNMYLTIRNSATTRKPSAKFRRRQPSHIASLPTCSGTIRAPSMHLPTLACSTITYVLACTFLLLIAGHQNELKCMHETLHNCTPKNKRTKLCAHAGWGGLQHCKEPGALNTYPDITGQGRLQNRQGTKRKWEGRKRRLNTYHDITGQGRLQDCQGRGRK